MPPLTPYTSLDKHFRYIKSLLPANDPSPAFRRASAAPASRVEVYTSAVHKARYSSRELDESEFIGAMEAGEWLLGVCVLLWCSAMTSVENRDNLAVSKFIRTCCETAIQCDERAGRQEQRGVSTVMRI